MEGFFFSNFEEELFDDELESAGELTGRAACRNAGFGSTSTAGDTTRLEPPLCGLGGAMTAVCVVQLRCAHYVRLK